MKYLEPIFTYILMSQMKSYLREALDAFSKQTRSHDVWMILVDSGVRHEKEDERSVKMRYIYALYNNHPNIDWYFSEE